jgi:hypothetical protein
MTGNGYPFVTRRQVLERLDRDPAFVRSCVEILHRRYLERALLPPPAGWMSSHKKAGEGIYAKLASDASTAADIVTAAKIAKRYAKQLAKVFRRRTGGSRAQTRDRQAPAWSTERVEEQAEERHRKARKTRSPRVGRTYLTCQHFAGRARARPSRAYGGRFQRVAWTPSRRTTSAWTSVAMVRRCASEAVVSSERTERRKDARLK